MLTIPTCYRVSGTPRLKYSLPFEIGQYLYPDRFVPLSWVNLTSTIELEIEMGDDRNIVVVNVALLLTPQFIKFIYDLVNNGTVHITCRNMRIFNLHTTYGLPTLRK